MFFLFKNRTHTQKKKKQCKTKFMYINLESTWLIQWNQIYYSCHYVITVSMDVKPVDTEGPLNSLY